MKKILFASAAFSWMLFSACKKELDEPVVTPPSTPVSAVSETDLLKDSVYLYSKEIYLWDDLLPSYDQFNPRQYRGASQLETGSNVMKALKKFQPLDRFSFVTSKSASEGLQSGAEADMGFFVKAASADKVEPIDSVHWYVSYVYDKSAAGLAGVQRGWYINKINNSTISYNQASITVLNDVFFGSSNAATFEFVKPDGSTVSSNLNKSDFVKNSVLHKSVIETSGKKVGYLVFNQFLGEPSRVELRNAFSSFKSSGVNELVLDLRYNPGGSTQTQDELANLVAPASANNQVMYKYIFNKKLQAGTFPLLQKKNGYSNSSFSENNNTQKFSSTGGLGLTRVFIIVSKSSASASELLINNLKPYMDVKLIGDTTYGKPVGFFPVNIADFALYPISFKTVNSVGNADYYSGFAPDKSSPDGVTYNWGERAEPSLASALRFIQSGAFRASSLQKENLYKLEMKAQKQLEPATWQLERNKFSGMFVEKD